MAEKATPALFALDVGVRPTKSVYPAEFAARVSGREKRKLGDAFGLANFGVNLTRLEPGTMSSVRHAHGVQDEFIYVLEGTPTLVTDEGETPMTPGMCAGFRAGSGNAHHLLNRSDRPVLYLEVGDRLPGDSAMYPDDDLVALFEEGGWVFTHKDGTRY